MSKLASIVLNWIGGGKTPIPVRFLKSVDIPGNAPNSGNNKVHTLKVLNSLIETGTEQDVLNALLYDGHTPTKDELINIEPCLTKVYNIDSEFLTICYFQVNEYTDEFGINKIAIKIIAGYMIPNDQGKMLFIKIDGNDSYTNFMEV